jgi:hypothetical protein
MDKGEACIINICILYVDIGKKTYICGVKDDDYHKKNVELKI